MGVLRVFAEDRSLSDHWDDECEYVFPSLFVSPALGVAGQGGHPAVSQDPGAGKAADYISVKVCNLRSLAGVKMSGWTEFFDIGTTLLAVPV